VAGQEAARALQPAREAAQARQPANGAAARELGGRPVRRESEIRGRPGRLAGEPRNRTGGGAGAPWADHGAVRGTHASLAANQSAARGEFRGGRR
jgi:hypothetical protein